MRIMGTLVAIRAQQLKLDDGTGVLVVHSDLPIKGAIGQTIDVIMRRQSNSTTFKAETIIWNVSSENETLRRLELCYQGEKQFGYPCPSIATADVKRMILHGDGVTLEDLCLVLDAPQDQVQKMLQELQLAGEIYCNRQGCYVPL